MAKFNKVLAIETSCDDTSVALVRSDGWVEALESANQDDLHRPFGGVVPEIAGRNHTRVLLPVIDRVVGKSADGWAGIDGLVVTHRPGLVGSLLVGVVTAKSLSIAYDLPFVGVNHLEGHLQAPFLRDEKYQPQYDWGDKPYVGLAVSGGHTTLFLIKKLGEYEVLGTTIDDAAGEAYDKFAKMTGLGFPGGVRVDKCAQAGDSGAYEFPKALWQKGNMNFSFSGLKTAVQNQVQSMPEVERKERINDLAASFQKVVVDVLLEKLKRAVEKAGVKRAIITGGVSANSALRERSELWGQESGVEIMAPPLRYCTDNAAMIGYVGIQRLNNGERSEHTLGVYPQSGIIPIKRYAKG
jgi:N6-L-threonylcarbamoyladenine synthase